MILNKFIRSIPRSSVIYIQDHELQSPVVQAMMTSYDAVIQSKLGNPSKFLVSRNINVDIKDKYVDSFRTLNETTVAPDHWDGDPDSLPFEPTSEESAMEQLDEYIGAEINLTTKNGPQLVEVVSRNRDGSGTLIKFQT